MLTLDREFGFVFVTSHKYKIIGNLDPFKIKNSGNTEEERSIRKESTEAHHEEGSEANQRVMWMSKFHQSQRNGKRKDFNIGFS
jgi:hypothetical protein